jgi:hypothetical protein
MTHRDAAWQAAEDAAEAVGPEAGLFASVDMASFGESLLAVLTRAATHPVEIGEAGVRFWATLARIGQNTVARSVGSDAPPPIQAGRDKRFTDPA